MDSKTQIGDIVLGIQTLNQYVSELNSLAQAHAKTAVAFSELLEIDVELTICEHHKEEATQQIKELHSLISTNAKKLVQTPMLNFSQKKLLKQEILRLCSELTEAKGSLVSTETEIDDWQKAKDEILTEYPNLSATTTKELQEQYMKTLQTAKAFAKENIDKKTQICLSSKFDTDRIKSFSHITFETALQFVLKSPDEIINE